jgi:hypothetical protein
MEIQQDFKEFFESFNAHDVQFVLVGGYALAFHGVPRYTGDLDVLVNPVPENARRIMAALTDFGFGGLDLEAEDFCVPAQVIQLGVSPVRIDILTSLTGLSWDEALAGAESFDWSGVTIPVIGKEDLIANKKATGRTRDLADIEALEEPGQ